jgi:hypothetical protein
MMTASTMHRGGLFYRRNAIVKPCVGLIDKTLGPFTARRSPIHSLKALQEHALPLPVKGKTPPGSDMRAG